MIHHYIQAYSKAIQKNIEIMFNLKFTGKRVKRQIQFKSVEKLDAVYDTLVHIPFHGSVSGDYFLNLHSAEWHKVVSESLLGDLSFFDLKETLKELMNVISNEAVEALKIDFPGISLDTPRFFQGHLDFPEIQTFSFELTHKTLSPIYGVLCLNLRKSEIGRQLDEEIHAHAQAAQRAVQAEWAIKQIMATIPLGIICFDDQGNSILGGSSAYTAELLFKSTKTIEGQLLKKILPKEITRQKPYFLELYENFRARKYVTNESGTFIHPIEKIEFIKARQCYIYEISFIQFYQENKNSFILIIQDRTEYVLLERKIAQAEKAYTRKLEKQVSLQTSELKHINHHLQDLNQSLEKEKDKAEKASQFKSQFLAAISHDLRTPLHAIIGINDTLSRREAVRKHQEIASSLDIVNKSADRLLLLVNDLLDLSKLEAGKLPFKKSLFKLNDIWADCEAMMNSLLTGKNIKFQINKYFTDDYLVFSDKEKIQQVVTNLLGNAVKFTQQGVITLSLGQRKAPDKKRKAEYIYFQVQDTGIGIKQANAAKVFEMYVQVENKIETTYKGTGLGLSICKRIVDGLGGKISIQSKFGHGTTITFDVPNEKNSRNSQTIAKNKRPLSARELAKIKNKKVLFCDDDQFNRNFLEMVLKEKLNYTLVGSGRDAIKNVKATHYDLILLDIQMPDMDGWQTFQEIRLVDSDTPICALTAQALLEERQALLDFGFEGNLFKPFKEHDLLRFIYNKLT